MAQFKVDWAETKNPDWKLLALTDERGGQVNEVSVNRFDKGTTNVAFPTFDQIAPGATIEGNLWTNNSGKSYLFPIKPAPKNDGEVAQRTTGTSTPPPARTGGFGGVNKAMETKRQNIEEAQENKTQGIKVAASMRDATLITVAMLQHDPDLQYQETFKQVKAWYLSEWDKTEKTLDVPFTQ